MRPLPEEQSRALINEYMNKPHCVVCDTTGHSTSVHVSGPEVPGESIVTDPDTGGQKGEKPEAYALIPVEALAEIARVYGYGAKKYAPNNWRRGYAWSLSYSALQRHLNAFWSGEEIDPESSRPHLAHAAFHIMTLLTYSVPKYGTEPYLIYRSKDDRPVQFQHEFKKDEQC